MATFGIRTKNTSQNAHLDKILAVFEKHGVQPTFGYSHKQNSDEVIGGRYSGNQSDEAIAEVNALPIPKSVKIGW